MARRYICDGELFQGQRRVLHPHVSPRGSDARSADTNAPTACLPSVSIVSPAVMRQGPFRFSSTPAIDPNRPTSTSRVTLAKPNTGCDRWPSPTTGYSDRELRVIARIVEGHRDEFLRVWDAFFG